MPPYDKVREEWYPKEGNSCDSMQHHRETTLIHVSGWKKARVLPTHKISQGMEHMKNKTSPNATDVLDAGSGMLCCVNCLAVFEVSVIDDGLKGAVPLVEFCPVCSLPHDRPGAEDGGEMGARTTIIWPNQLANQERRT